LEVMKIVKYYNQNNYANYPYPSPSNKSATIKSGGCGPTCISMIVETLTDQAFPPPMAAKFAIDHNARTSGGTIMRILGKAACNAFGLEMTTTNDINLLTKHIRNGGLAVANVGGDRPGWIGVFSDSGHYVVVGDILNKTISVYDPALYSGKFNKVGRKGKVGIIGHECKCDISVLAKDTENRNPRYYLFKKKEAKKVTDNNKVSDWAKNAQKWVIENKISDGKNPKSPVTREEVWVMLYRLENKGI
jgi:hypothetical protein